MGEGSFAHHDGALCCDHNDEELTRLFQRRKEQGLRVVPIIVREYLWQSEPVLKDLQALPKDGKPVIGFSEATGARDQVWTEIAQAIEAIAKKDEF